MQELLIATKNPGKFLEISEALKGLPFKFVFLGDLDLGLGGNLSGNVDFFEDGKTFAENALKKARFYAEKTGLMTLAEDSGIIVEALKGELGVQTRRWGAGESASDKEWVEYFLERMKGVENRNGEFACCACLVRGLDGKGKFVENFFEGKTKGVITDELMAPILAGLPLSSCFLPEGCDKVYAALGAEEKNKISHRGKAMREVREFLEWLSGGK